MHNEPDNHGDAIHGLYVAFMAEALVVSAIIVAVALNIHAIEQVFAWAE